MDEKQYVIKYKNVDLSFDKNILKSINLEIEKGEFVYLIGKTGSGKSSLLRSIYADIPIEQGEAMVCGYDLNKIKRSQIPHAGGTYQSRRPRYARSSPSACWAPRPACAY